MICDLTDTNDIQALKLCLKIMKNIIMYSYVFLDDETAVWFPFKFYFRSVAE